MAAFCVLVKGPCRGKMCDFWARVRLRKAHIDELVQELRKSIFSCEEHIGSDLEDLSQRLSQSIIGTLGWS
jgi:hypothetical protein